VAAIRGAESRWYISERDAYRVASYACGAWTTDIHACAHGGAPWETLAVWRGGRQVRSTVAAMAARDGMLTSSYLTDYPV
jgi:hypothetical protein